MARNTESATSRSARHPTPRGSSTKRGGARGFPARRELGSVLRAFRERLAISQERLGFAADLHRNYIGSAERGERNVSFEGLVRWLDALGVSWEEFGAAIDASVRRKGRW